MPVTITIQQIKKSLVIFPIFCDIYVRKFFREKKMEKSLKTFLFVV